MTGLESTILREDHRDHQRDRDRNQLQASAARYSSAAGFSQARWSTCVISALARLREDRFQFKHCLDPASRRNRRSS